MAFLGIVTLNVLNGFFDIFLLGHYLLISMTSLFLNFRRSPISIAAAVIYIITQLSDDKKPLKG